MKKETEAHRVGGGSGIATLNFEGRTGPHRVGVGGGGGGGSGRTTLNFEGRVPTLLYTHQLGYSLIYCEIY